MYMRNLIILSLSLCLSLSAMAKDKLKAVTPEMERVAQELMQAARNDNHGWELLESLTTEVGPRLAGSKAEARARDWAVAKLNELGFAGVRVEDFLVPIWVRGEERAEIVSPFPQPLIVTALGGSPSTGESGVTGEVVSYPDVKSAAALERGALEGKVLFIDEPMTQTQDGSGYGMAVEKRYAAAKQAERLGAVAALIRSVSTGSHRFAHTGDMLDLGQAGTGPVPAAALAGPDADQLGRALARGEPVTVKLVLTPKTLPPARSGNVIAEIPGRQRSIEFALFGAHLDSWDLGTGAIDDGAGVAIVVAAAHAMKKYLGDRPARRGIRIVLFGAEEVGLVGAKAYAEQHKDELSRHTLATESDFGAGEIWRFDTGVVQGKVLEARSLGAVFAPMGISLGKNDASGGPDIGYLHKAGVPVVRLKQNGWDYFNYHHTADDTLDKVDPEALSQNVAAYAALMYLAAETPVSFR
jgi:hypothetical protein